MFEIKGGWYGGTFGTIEVITFSIYCCAYVGRYSIHILSYALIYRVLTLKENLNMQISINAASYYNIVVLSKKGVKSSKIISNNRLFNIFNIII